MNPHQKNKIDVTTLSPEEQRLFRLYGKLPSQPSIFARNNQRKYFDSGDYALNKAGKGDGVDNGNVGSIVPDVDTIRHASAASTPNGGAHPAGGAAGSSSSSTLPTLSSPGLAKSGSGSLHQPGGGLPSSGIPVGSPAKESSLQRETSIEEAAAENDEGGAADGQGIPIRS